MAIIFSNVITKIDFSTDDIISYALKILSVTKDEIKIVGIHKSSLDARNNNNIKRVSSVYVELFSREKEEYLAKRFRDCNICTGENLPKQNYGEKNLDGRIVVVGFGPAGMFSALYLAEQGYKPLVLERGDKMDERVTAVSDFWSFGKLSERSNVQFGEGGAGTFSDGKLTTRIKDPYCRYVLEKFVEFGAPKDILSKAKPHVGTDNIREIVVLIRKKIESLGGEFRFNSCVTDIKLSGEKVSSLEVNGEYDIKCGAVILAIGHSARDTFCKLFERGVKIEAKPFSVGVRIEHTQEEVNRSLYGNNFNNPHLPVGEYQMSYRENGRGVYTFCMCPGGRVVPSSSEEGTVVVNGMSEYARNEINANSAIAVSVEPSDYGTKSPLDGIDFARKIEKSAFISGGGNYNAPITTVSAFKKGGKAKMNAGRISPSYQIGTKEANFDEIFPSFVTEMLRKGLDNFSKKMWCFGNGDAVLTAPETRTSSPIRILRNEIMESTSAENLYPCGEGAGYAGGIMSSAVDGMKVANTIISKYKKYEKED